MKKKPLILAIIGVGLIIFSSVIVFEKISDVDQIKKQKEEKILQEKLEVEKYASEKFEADRQQYKSYLKLARFNIVENNTNEEVMLVENFKYETENDFTVIDEIKFSMLVYYGFSLNYFITEPDTKSDWYVSKQSDNIYKVRYLFIPSDKIKDYGVDSLGEFRADFILDKNTMDVKPDNNIAENIMYKIKNNYFR